MKRIGGTWKNVVTLDDERRLLISYDLREFVGFNNYTGTLAICESAIADAIFLTKIEEIGNSKVYGTLNLDDKGRVVISSKLFSDKINQFEIFVSSGKLYLVPIEC